MPQAEVDGARLFECVETYAGLGDHRAGTAVDARTAAWVADRLGATGLTVTTIPVPFDRWDGSSELLADELPVSHLAVPYEFTGSIETDAVHVTEIDPRWGGDPGVLSDPVAEARRAGAEAAVVATSHPEGSLVAMNRDLAIEPTGFPTFLVGGRELGRCRGAALRVGLHADVVAGSTTNVVAHNAIPGDPLILTTPLTGWFGCAGERGTGIAVLLHLVEALADLPLMVVATGGHELTHIGADAWVEACDTPAAAVVHVGASVAVVEPGTAPDRPLAATRLARTSLGAGDAPAMARTLEAARLDLQHDSTVWKGEAQTFCRLGFPLLSFTGAGRDFHCPEDTPERATTPQALATVATAFTEAARQLYEATATQ